MYNRRQYDVPQPFSETLTETLFPIWIKSGFRAMTCTRICTTTSHNSLKIVLRGEDALPIYVPSGRKIVNSTSRFLAKDMDYYIEPETKDGVELDEPTRAYLEKYLTKLVQARRRSFEVCIQTSDGDWFAQTPFHVDRRSE